MEIQMKNQPIIQAPASPRVTTLTYTLNRKLGGSRQGEMKMTLTVLVPALLFYVVFRYYPVIQTLVLSLTDARLLRPDYTFIGAQNFATLFTDPVFLKVLWNTTYYSFVTTAATTVLALILAFLLDPIRYGISVYRLIYYLPVITSAIAIATIWRWLYQPRFGFFNQVLGALGIQPIPWLTSVEWAMPSIIIMSIWGGVGFATLIFVAGLKGIPKDYTEAAIIDGAASWQTIWFIKLPLLSRVTSFIFITGIIGSFQVFQQVYLMTGGGPLNASRVLALHIYDHAFQRSLLGLAASMSVVLFVVVSVFTILQMRWQRSDWEL
jgi:multiple sugar transport system permease protein